MARNFTYTFEDSDGELHEWEIVYTISKAYPGTREQPPEPAEIEISSIQESGIEVEADEKTLERIELEIWNDQDEPDYDFED